MRIFVTGGAGFIGRSFMRRLLAVAGDDWIVWSLVRNHGKSCDPRVVELVGDLETIASHREALLASDYVFHLAANATFGNDIDYDAVNLAPVLEMLEILKASSCLRSFVFTSTIGAVDRSPNDPCLQPISTDSTPSPRSRYGVSKLKAEQAIRASGLPFTIIRPTWVYGRDMRTGSHINRFVSMVSRRHPITRFALPGRVSVIHVDDLSKALTACIDNAKVLNRTYFAETEAISLGTIFSKIATKLGMGRGGDLTLPFPAVLLRRIHARLPLTVANLFIDYLCASDPAFRKDFGLVETVCFEQGIDDVIATNIHRAGYWLVTGANSGIGLALASQLHAMGKKLLLVDQQVDHLGQFSDAEVICADLSIESGVEDVCRAASSHKIAVLINNAGIGQRGALGETSPDTIKRIYAVNVLAPVLLTRQLLPNLITNESVIVNIASSIAYNPLPYMSLYSSSKAAVSNWSESLSYELRKTNRVVTFSPSGTLTGFQKTAGVKVLNEGRGLLKAEDVAARIINAVTCGSRVVILGCFTKILLLVSRLIPRSLNITLWGKLFEQYR